MRNQAHFRLFLRKGLKATIFDIDNTLTHSRFFQKNGIPHEEFQINPKMKSLVLKCSEDSDIYFLSARSFLLWATTLRWLKSNFFDMNRKLYLVRKMEDKWYYIRWICSKYKEVELYEDFTTGTIEEIKINLEFKRKVEEIPNLKIFDWNFLEPIHHEILT